MTAGPMPAAEVDIDARLVRRLIDAQFPQWSGLPLRAVGTIGWDNALFRLGTELVVRVPRRQLGADCIAIEQRWLPEIAPRLAVRVPTPVGIGEAAEGYPWPWSVCPWFPGRMAAVAGGINHVEVAHQLAVFLRAMHVQAPPDAPVHPYGRGGSLAQRDADTKRRIAESPEPFDRALLTEAWGRATSAQEWDGPDLWLHGDLHPANLLVSRGRLGAVLDFGDLCAGDPAADLVSAWMLLPGSARRVLQEESEVDAHTWDRGRGWALSLGLAMLERSSDNPVIDSIGRRGIEAALLETQGA
jgi:aminoglycoside phosphotransferase (APT) family kinase protein